jgi:hypothetical protein
VAAGRSTLFQLDTMEVLASLLASRMQKNIDFASSSASRAHLAPYVFDRCDTNHEGAQSRQAEAERLLRRQGYVTISGTSIWSRSCR